jgi:hypothetical protein
MKPCIDDTCKKNNFVNLPLFKLFNNKIILKFEIFFFSLIYKIKVSFATSLESLSLFIIFYKIGQVEIKLAFVVACACVTMSLA